MHIINIDEVDSTNLYAKNNLANLVDRTIISAKHQTAGRGRFDRSWIDLGDDNIFASIVLKPSENFSKIYPNLTQYLSVVLCKTLEEYGTKPSIKWPNDVLINGKKIAGILSETVMKGQHFKGLILGFGVNLNSDLSSISKIKDKVATSLNIELNKKHIDKNDFLHKLLEKFFDNYDEFLNNGFVMIKDEYQSRTSFLNKEISVQVLNEKVTGCAKYLTDSGELVIEKNNKEYTLTMGDIL